MELPFLSLFLTAVVAGYALLGLTLLLPDALAQFVTLIQIVGVFIVVIFSVVLIVHALRALFNKS